MNLVLPVAFAALALIGAVTVVLTRDVMRLALGFGAFLLAVAGLFALHGFGFLALAQIFIYVGGVLVLILFAIMLIHRGEDGTPALSSRHDPLAAVASAGVALLAGQLLTPYARALDGVEAHHALVDLSSALLGDWLPHFELAGLLLLAALVAVVSVSGGDRR